MSEKDGVVASVPVNIIYASTSLPVDIPSGAVDLKDTQFGFDLVSDLKAHKEVPQIPSRSAGIM